MQSNEMEPYIEPDFDSSSSHFPAQVVSLPQVFHPWRRYFARMLDLYIYGLLFSAFLGLICHVNLTSRSSLGTLFDAFVALAIMLFLEPLLLHLFRTTLGKTIFGLRIEYPDDTRLTYGEGLTRTWGLLGKGMGYNIPIYNLVCQWKSYKLCSEQETQPWDESIAYTIKDTKWYRAVLFIVATAAFVWLFLVLLFSQLLPPNRGELTVPDFTENFNYYAEYFDIGFHQNYFDENGRWVDQECNGNSSLSNLVHPEPPEYHYTLENGALTGLSFTVEIKNSQTPIRGCDTQMLLSALAFAGAQKEAGLFSNAPERLSNQLETGTLEGFDFTEFGVAFSCNIEQVGYIGVSSDYIFPDENAVETYFKLDFSMHKVS